MLDDPIWLDGDLYRMPHLVLGRDQHRWTSVVLFLRKPTAAQMALHAAPRVAVRAVRNLARLARRDR
jgi:hypothetical protein